MLAAVWAASVAPAPARDRPSAPTVTCAACIVVDDTGAVLYARAADAELPNASTTKMVTALVTIRDSSLDETVTVSRFAAATGGGGLDLQAGDVYTVEGLLYALLLSSSNDAAVALAEHAAGSEDAFVTEMNELAASLGARHTHFANAHGLDAPGHYSSARDLARIAIALLRRPALARIVATAHAVVQGPRGSVPLDNRNVLLETYPGAIGVKTGYTAGAGDVLVAAARRHHRRLIAVAMHSVSAAADDTALLDFGWERLRRGVLLAAGASVGEIVGPAGATPVLSGGEARGYERPGSLVVTFEPSDALALPVRPGEEVGRAVVTAGSRTVASVPAVAAAVVDPEDGSWGAEALSGVIGGAARALEAIGAL